MLRKIFQDDSTRILGLKQVYQLISQYGPITKGKLIELSNIKQTTLVRFLNELLKNNLIVINGYEESSGGRPPALYVANPKSGYIIGIDLARTHTKIVLVDLSFQIIEQENFAITKLHTPDYTLKRIVQVINEILDKNGLTDDNLLGIGLGAVGPLAREQGIILEPEGFPAEGWKNVRIVKELSTHFRTKIILENGVNTAALAEYYHAGLSYGNLLYCLSGVGLRCGVLANGQFVQNKSGDASGFGHMVISVNDGSENRTLSSFISLDTILEETKQRISVGENSSLLELAGGNYQHLTIEQLVVGLQMGDQLLDEIIMKSAYYYGIGLANMINILHPEHIILSSILINEHPNYFEKVIETAKKHIYNYNKLDLTFEKSYLKEDAVAIGATRLIFNSYFQ